MAYFFYLDEYFKGDDINHLRTWNRLKKKIIKQFGKPNSSYGDLETWSCSLTTYMPGIPRGVYFAKSEDASAFKLIFGKAEQREGGFGK